MDLLTCPRCFACFEVTGAISVSCFDIDAREIVATDVKYCPICGEEVITKSQLIELER